VSSPIQRVVGQVFIPVRNMQHAAAWYARLLGLPPAMASHRGTILDLPVDEGPRLALDANRPDFTTDAPPRFFWWTDDMAATLEHLRRMGARITSEVEDIGSVVVVQFDDPDGNPLMVCQRTG
jgi:predicted enzyme related to lactoylglutathione lyase